jgi:hypothetical protein
LPRVTKSQSTGEDNQLIVSGREVVEYNIQKAVGRQLIGEGDQVLVPVRRQSTDCVRRSGC